MEMEKERELIIVTGATGFIGANLCSYLKNKNKEAKTKVLGIDIKEPEGEEKPFDYFLQLDLRKQQSIDTIKEFIINIHKKVNVTKLFHLSADMGGAEYIFTGDNDYNILSNNMKINTNICEFYRWLIEEEYHNTILFFSSSACVYNQEYQLVNKKEEMKRVGLKEGDIYPAYPDSEYGWEKIIAERLFMSFQRRNPNARVVIGRFHNIYGKRHSVSGELEPKKRKVIESLICKIRQQSVDTDLICKIKQQTVPDCDVVNESKFRFKVFGDGEQTRSFLHVDVLIETVMKLIETIHKEPIDNIVNVGSTECVSIKELIEIISRVLNVKVKEGQDYEFVKEGNPPVGVYHRNSNNDKIKEILNGWEPTMSMTLEEGIRKMTL